MNGLKMQMEEVIDRYNLTFILRSLYRLFFILYYAFLHNIFYSKNVE